MIVISNLLLRYEDITPQLQLELEQPRLEFYTRRRVNSSRRTIYASRNQPSRRRVNSSSRRRTVYPSRNQPSRRRASSPVRRRANSASRRHTSPRRR